MVECHNFNSLLFFYALDILHIVSPNVFNRYQIYLLPRHWSGSARNNEMIHLIRHGSLTQYAAIKHANTAGCCLISFCYHRSIQAEKNPQKTLFL